MNWRCRLGLHDWREESVGHHAVVLLRCIRASCGKYKAVWVKR